MMSCRPPRKPSAKALAFPQASLPKYVEAEKRKEQEFFVLAEQFRSASDPEEARRLGDKLGRMVFGD